jgi:hypothetical protein
LRQILRPISPAQNNAIPKNNSETPVSQSAIKRKTAKTISSKPAKFKIHSKFLVICPRFIIRLKNTPVSTFLSTANLPKMRPPLQNKDNLSARDFEI